MPAEYYSAPTPDPVLPRWASYGCGAASLVILAVIFIGGAYLSRGGFTDLMDLALGMSLGEMRGMYADDLAAGPKQSLENEIAEMRRNLREEKISVAHLQPFLNALRDVTRDDTVTADDAARLEEIARKINARAKRGQAL